MINFVSGGHTGDLIHELYIIKNICDNNNIKANLYITDSSSKINQCLDFSFNIDKIYDDTKEFIQSQYYINDYQILPKQYKERAVNISHWRNSRKFINWTELLCFYYKILPNREYKWINIKKEDKNTVGKILIHHSNRRNNNKFNWDILSQTKKEILFITSDISEYDKFKIKNTNVSPYIVSNVSEMAISINSCDLFIGNQSMPFALSCALDKPRICELYGPSSMFYIYEEMYSKNISWYLTDDIKYNSKNVELKV